MRIKMSVSSFLSLSVLLALYPLPASGENYQEFNQLRGLIPNVVPECMVANENHLVIVTSNKLQVFDVSDNLSPVELSSIVTGDSGRCRIGIDDSLIILQYAETTNLLSISPTGNLGLLAALPGGQNFAHCGTKLFIGGPTAISKVYDITDTANPVNLSDLDLGGALMGGIGDRVVVEHVISYSNPSFFIRNLILFNPEEEFETAPKDTLHIVHDDPYCTTERHIGIIENTSGYWVVRRLQTYSEYCGPSDFYYRFSFLGSFQWNGRIQSRGKSPVLNTENSTYLFTKTDSNFCGEWIIEATGKDTGDSFLLFSQQSRMMTASLDYLAVAKAGTGQSPGGVFLYDLGRQGNIPRETLRDNSSGPQIRVIPNYNASSEAVSWLSLEHFCSFGGSGCDENQEFHGASFVHLLTDNSGQLDFSTFETSGINFGASLLVEPEILAVTYYTGNNRELILQSPDGAEVFSSLPNIGVSFLHKFDDEILASGNDGLTLINYSDVHHPEIVDTWTGSSLGQCVFSGNQLFSTNTPSSGIKIFTYSPESSFQHLNTIPTNDKVESLQIQDSSLWYAEGSTLHVVDISNPNNSTPMQSFELMYPINSFCVSGPYIYAACGAAGLLVYEFNTVGELTYLGGDPLGQAIAVSIFQGRLVLTTTDGIQLLPLQEGDPLPNFLSDFTGFVNREGFVELSWQTHGDFTGNLRLVQLQNGGRTTLQYSETSLGGFTAIDFSPVLFNGVYSYNLMLQTHDGNWQNTDSLEIPVRGLQSGIRSISPNPFNPETNIKFYLEMSGIVELTIYDLRGLRIRTISSGYTQAGDNISQWDGADSEGRSAPAGTYFCRLKTDSQIYSEKLILIK